MLVYYGCVFAPLVSFLIVGLLGKMMDEWVCHLVSCGFMALSAVCGGMIAYDVMTGGQSLLVPLANWITVGSFSATWSLYFDPLSSVMVCVVTLVSFLVHVYSIGYMKGDDGVPRFMAYLGLFTFMMLMLVTAGNVIQLFFGWEGVGLASYLLIGFWYQRDSAAHAGIKAFVVNRVGDVGLVLASGAIYMVFKTVDFEQIMALLPAKGSQGFWVMGSFISVFDVIGFFLLLGAMGKSAQLGLHTWLADAMEGPTPVSALIHAATMVTAGVFLLVRFSPLLELAPMAQGFIVIIGASTALIAATIGLVQRDIKRVIAYSTCSQLGYMFFAVGLGAYHLAIFHLVTHAFFKALLFLGAGSVIHALSDEQDMAFMGGILKGIPATAALMAVGSLSLCGIPFFAGYYSKDAILDAAFLSAAHGAAIGQYAYVLGLVAAFLTALYSFRLFSLTFLGRPRAPEPVMERLHESGYFMLIPCAILGIGAIFSGYILAPMMMDADFWRGSLVLTAHGGNEESLTWFWKTLPVWVASLGIVVGIILYHGIPGLFARFKGFLRPFHTFLANQWYIDALYDYLFVRPALWGGRILCQAVDHGIIDRYGPDGLARSFGRMTVRLSYLQNGLVPTYGLIMGAAIAAYLAYSLF